MKEATTQLEINREGTFAILESFPYTLQEALSDIIDNSLDAGAKTVLVELNHEGDEQYVVIKDDGKGISESEFEQVMEIGRRRQYSPQDLGAFGVGLKSAGLTHARNITIFSKQIGDKMNVRRISVPWMKETGRWKEMLHSDTNSPVVEKISEKGYLPNEQGTTVLLENLWRFDSMADEGQSNAVTIMNILPQIENHLRMTYHRFLENSDHPRHFSLIFPASGHDSRLTPLNPMEPHEDDKNYGTLTQIADVTIEYEGSEFVVPVSLIVVPHSKRCRDKKFRKELSKTVDGGTAELEGIYIYRNDRLIAFARWFGLGLTKTAVGTLRRMTIDIEQKLDSYFGLTPSKTNYRLPLSFRNKLTARMSEKRRWSDSDKNKKMFTEKANHRYRTEGSGVGSKRKVQHPKRNPSKPPNVPTPNPLTKGSGANADITKEKISPEDQHVDSFVIKEVADVEAPLFEIPDSIGNVREIELNKIHPWYFPLKTALKGWLDDE